MKIGKRELRNIANRYAYHKRLADGNFIGKDNAKIRIIEVYQTMDTLGLMDIWYPIVKEEIELLEIQKTS